MISRIHSKLGTAGFIISIVALVVALGGGAYAASGGLTGKQKKEVEKIAKKYAGKPGAPGAAGPTGSGGAKGDTGAAGTGTNGTAGANGTNGTNGTNGKSVVLGTASNTECASGGTTVAIEGSTTKKAVCNGVSGFTETLPSGKTETGTWAISIGNQPEFAEAVVPISFNIPLKESGEAIYVDETETTAGTNATCTGTVEHPTAPAGALCVYTAEEGATGFIQPPEFRFNLVEGEYEPAGTVLRYFTPTANAKVNGSGTYAVTAAP